MVIVIYINRVDVYSQGFVTGVLISLSTWTMIGWFVLGSFPYFNIEIANSNFTFCGV